MRVLVVVTLLAACTQYQVRTTHRVGEVATAGGLIGMLTAVTLAAVIPAHEDTLIHAGVIFIPVTLAGALAFVATDSLVNGSHSASPTPSRRERQREVAWELTKQAAEAARSSDCREVSAIAPRVRDLDHDFHSRVFMRDVAIQRCLRER